MVSTLSTGIVFTAVTTKTPSDITFELTGKTVDQVTQEKVSGKTYGTIANEAGKLEELKQRVLYRKNKYLIKE